MLVAIGNHVNNIQNYTNVTEADSIELDQSQGNTDDTIKLQVRDPLSSFPITPEDELYLMDETDPNGFPTVNLLANGSFEGSYNTGVAPSWAGNNLSAPGGSGTPTIAKVQSKGTGNSGTATSITATLSSNTTANNLVVAIIGFAAGSGTITAPSGWSTAWTLTSDTTHISGCYYLIDTAGGHSSFTFTFSGTASVAAASLSEWSSSTGWGSNPLDKTVTNYSSTTTTTFTTGTTAATGSAVELSLAGFVSGNSLFSAWSAPTNGYTLDDGASDGTGGTVTAGMSYKLLSAVSSGESTGITASTNARFEAGIATFAPPTGTGGGVTVTSSSSAMFGSQSQSLQTTNVTSGNTFGVFQRLSLPTNENGVVLTALPYTFSCWYNISTAISGATLAISIEWWNSNYTTKIATSSVAIPTAATSGWQRASVTASAPSSGSPAAVACTLYLSTTSGTNSGTVLFDGAQLEYNTFAFHQRADYVPGQLANTTLATHGPGTLADGWVPTGAASGVTYAQATLNGAGVQSISLASLAGGSVVTNPAAMTLPASLPWGATSASSSGGGPSSLHGIMQDQLVFNPRTNYTLTCTYYVNAALDGNTQVVAGVTYETTAGSPMLTATTSGPTGQGASNQASTITLRFGPNTGNPPPTSGSVGRLQVFAGLDNHSFATSATAQTVYLLGLSITADPAQQQPTTGGGMSAAAANIYPTPYVDEHLAGDYMHSVWQDREVTNLYYRALRLFGGNIKQAKRNYSMGPECVWDLDAVDFGQLLSEAIVQIVIRSASLTLSQLSATGATNTGLPDYQAIALACNYAHNQGFLKGLDWTTHVAYLTDIPAMAFNFTTVKDVLAAVADVTVGAFWVDPYKYLWYQAALSVSAPFNVSYQPDNTTTYPFAQWSLDYDSTNTRNVMIVQGQTQVSAPQQATFNGAQGMTLQSALAANTTYSQVALSGLPNHLLGGSMVTVGNNGSSSSQTFITSVTVPAVANWPSAPSASSGTSTFASGAYRVAYSLVYASGVTSGTFETPVNAYASVTVTGTTQVISVPAITALPSGVSQINYYVSTAANGTTLGFSKSATVSSGTAAATTVTAPGNGTVPQTVYQATVTAFTPTSAWSAGTAATVTGFQVNSGLPIFSVTGVTQGGVAQTVGLSSTDANNPGSFDVYSDPQPAQITWDSTNYPNGPPSGVGNVVINFTIESPVMVRLLSPTGTKYTDGRWIAFYQQVNNIQSNADAIDQAQALLTQYQQPMPIGHLTLYWPPCPPAQILRPGQFIRITHPPSLQTTNPVSFQIQKVTTRVSGAGTIIRQLDVGFFRPDFSKMMSQITQDAAHLEADLNATSIVEDVLSVQDTWTLTDSVSGTVGHQGVWAPAAASGLASGYSGSLWGDGTAWG